MAKKIEEFDTMNEMVENRSRAIRAMLCLKYVHSLSYVRWLITHLSRWWRVHCYTATRVTDQKTASLPLDKLRQKKAKKLMNDWIQKVSCTTSVLLSDMLTAGLHT